MASNASMFPDVRPPRMPHPRGGRTIFRCHQPTRLSWQRRAAADTPDLGSGRGRRPTEAGHEVGRQYGPQVNQVDEAVAS